MKILLLTSVALLLASPALADKMKSNPLTPSEYLDSVRTLDEKYAALRGEKEIELAELRQQKEQKEKELADLESSIKSAKDELTETLNRNNSRKIQAGLPVEMDSAPQKVKLSMEAGTVRIWPAPRPFMNASVGLLKAKPVAGGGTGNVTVNVGDGHGDASDGHGGASDSSVLSVRPGDGDANNADLVISAHEEGFGNIILTDKKGEVIADLQVQVVGHAKPIKSSAASGDKACTKFPNLCPTGVQ
jgi:hypothetical protein